MKALYHQAGGSVTLDVIGKPKNGRADLGRDNQVLVADVSASKAGEPGTYTILTEEDGGKEVAEAKAKAEAEAKAKAEAEARAKAEAEAKAKAEAEARAKAK